MQQPFLMKRDTVSGPARSDADKNIGQKRRTTNELRRIYGPGISHLQHHPLLFGAGDAYLMLHRIKKQDDYNHDKWVGVGGKFERFESPEDCLVREVREETGLTLTRYRARGLLTFVWGNMTEFIHLYTADRWEGEMIRGDACAEGELQWVQKSEVQKLPIWEGDKLFFRLLEEENPYFSLKLVYDGDTLKQAVLDGKRIV